MGIDMKKKSALPLDAGVAIAIIAIIVILLLEGFVRQDIPDLASRFPLAVFVIVIAIGIAEATRSILARKKENEALEADPGKKAAPKPVFKNFKNFMVISCMIIVYSILMYLIGFIASTIVFSIAFVFFFKFKRVVLFSLCSIVGTVAVNFCFANLMHIRLPVGELVEKFL